MYLSFSLNKYNLHIGASILSLQTFHISKNV